MKTSSSEARLVRVNRVALVRRVRFLSFAVTFFLVVVSSGFWFVQVVKGSYYRDLADNNRLRRRVLPALRGQIFDRHGRPLAGNVASYDLLIDREHSLDPDRSIEQAAGLLGRSVEELVATMSKDRLRGGGLRPLLLASNLTLSEVARIGAMGLELPELEVRVHHLRLYRQAEQTAHILGYLSEVGPEELEAKVHPYRLGEVAGKKGLEKVFEDLLRGSDGEREVVVDSRGRLVQEASRIEPLSGHDLRLTLDLDLQQEAYRLLGEQVGAVVALDPSNGAVRALVSTPSFDPNRLIQRIEKEDWQAIMEAPHQPLQNRTLQNTYSPGSLFKIPVALAGLETGAISRNDKVWCGGSTKIYNHRFRCWKQGGHGWVDVIDALKHSCDVYFYHLGKKLGIRGLSGYARRFGFGQRTGIELSGEKSGLVPDPDWSERVRKSPWYPGETISVAIGQGPLLTSPLQIAVMFAAVANGGSLVTPHLVEGQELEPRPIGIEASALEIVQEGLWAVINDNGTGRSARLGNVEMAGKTGTVQVVSQKTWTKSEDLPPELRDHAWFASYAPFEQASLVVVVFVEHGGHGSSVAAPIAKQIYERFFELHPVERTST